MPSHDPSELIELHHRIEAALRRGDRKGARVLLSGLARMADSPGAQFNVAALYDRAGDQDAALEFYRRSARAGFVDAMNNLGVMLKNRDEHAEAGSWLRKAAATGDIDAAWNLGRLLHALGEYDEAIEWYRGPAEAGNGEAMMNLASLLASRGDHRQARKWYKRAGRAGIAIGPMLAAELPKRDTRRAAETPAPSRPITVDPGDPLGNLVRLRESYTATGDDEKLRLALSMAAATAVGSTAVGSTAAASVAAAVEAERAVLLRLKYERDRAPGDLKASLDAARRAVALCGDDEHRPKYLMDLGNALQEEFMRTGAASAIEEAVEAQREAEALVDPDDPLRPHVTSNLANGLMLAAGKPPDRATIAEAVVYAREAAAAKPDGTTTYILATVLVGYAAATGNEGLAAEALDAFREAGRRLPPGHPAQARIRTILRGAGRFR